MSRLALAAAAIAAAAVLVPAVAGDDPPPLKFAWPVPSKGRVTETILRNGVTATTRCTATLDKTEDGAALRLHLSDWEIVEFQGRGPSDPGFASQVRLTLLGLKVTPDLVIAKDGTVKEVIGIETFVDTMFREIEKGTDEAQKATLPVLRERFLSPQGRASLEKGVTQIWTTWVGDWVGRVIPAGDKGTEGPHKVVCPDMVEYEVPTRFRRLPGEKEGPGLVLFLRESTLDGEDARPILTSILKQLEQATGKAPPATSMRFEDHALTAADPETLLPKRVLREQLLTLQLKDLPARTDVERHEYKFEWEPPPAQPAGEVPK